MQLTTTAGLPLDAACALMGALMPEGAKAMETPSLGMCTLTLLPLMTCSTMACILPERWKKGRYCLALRVGEEPGRGHRRLWVEQGLSLGRQAGEG